MPKLPEIQVVIPAAGEGLRLGRDCPKAMVPLGNKPILVHTLEQFSAIATCAPPVIVVHPDHVPVFEAALTEHLPDQRVQIIPGGQERQDSVLNGLNALAPEAEIVVIHDAARPFIATEAIHASIEAAAAYGAATVAIPSVDTILEGDADAFLRATPDRSRLWACQTPQTFQVRVILEAHAKARQEGFLGTDDASLVQRYGGQVKLVQGNRLNMKITTPEDLHLAKLIIDNGLV